MATLGGGLVSLANSLLSNNTALYGGGALLLDSADSEAVDSKTCSLSDNSAAFGESIASTPR